MKNILFISSALRYFESSATTRNIGLVNALSQHHHVYSIEFVSRSVVTPVEDFRIYGERIIRIDKYREESTNSNKSEFGFLTGVNAAIRKKVKSLFRDRLFSTLKGKELNEAISSFGVVFDIVITSSDPVGVHWQFLISKAAKNPCLEGCEYIQYWGDPLLGDINNKDNYILRLVEKKLFKKASFVCWVSEATLNQKKMQYPEYQNKFVYLPRIIDTSPPRFKHPQLNLRNPLKLVYAGDYFSKSRDIGPLIEVLRNYQHHNLTVIGDGDSPTNIPKNVKILSRRPKHECDKFVNDADLIIILSNKNGSQVPGKVFELAASNKFVLVLDHNGLAKNIFPFKKRFNFIENNFDQINSFFSKEVVEAYHDFEEYGLGERTLNALLN